MIDLAVHASVVERYELGVALIGAYDGLGSVAWIGHEGGVGASVALAGYEGVVLLWLEDVAAGVARCYEVAHGDVRSCGWVVGACGGDGRGRYIYECTVYIPFVLRERVSTPDMTSKRMMEYVTPSCITVSLHREAPV